MPSLDAENLFIKIVLKETIDIIINNLFFTTDKVQREFIILEGKNVNNFLLL